MTYFLSAGCFLFAYGPAVILLLSYMARRSALLILTVSSGFFWLISMLLTSIIWIIVSPLKFGLQEDHAFGLLIGAVIQEGFRYLSLRIYTSVDSKLLLTDKSVGPRLFNDVSGSLSAGIGYGLMSTVTMYSSVIAQARYDATWFRPTCPSINGFIIAAVFAFCYNIFHIAISVLALDAIRRKNIFLSFIPFVAHVLFVLGTLLVELNDGCYAAIPVVFLLAGVSVLGAFAAVRSTSYHAKKHMISWSTSGR